MAYVTWNQMPEVIDFFWNNEDFLEENFIRLVKETTGLEKVFCYDEPTKNIIFKGIPVHTIVIRIDADKNIETIRRVMWLWYWFMENFTEKFPAGTHYPVMQTLE